MNPMPPTSYEEPDRAAHIAAPTAVHIVSARVLFAVFVALMLLTTVTVAVSYFDLGPINLLVALCVATAKAKLVALYFMHLRHDKPFHAIVFGIGIISLAVFLTITMLDSIHYHGDVEAWEERVR